MRRDGREQAHLSPVPSQPWCLGHRHPSPAAPPRPAMAPRRAEQHHVGWTRRPFKASINGSRYVLAVASPRPFTGAPQAPGLAGLCAGSDRWAWQTRQCGEASGHPAARTHPPKEPPPSTLSAPGQGGAPCQEGTRGDGTRQTVAPSPAALPPHDSGRARVLSLLGRLLSRHRRWAGRCRCPWAGHSASGHRVPATAPAAAGRPRCSPEPAGRPRGAGGADSRSRGAAGTSGAQAVWTPER